MNRRLKIVGMVLCAALAFTAFLASAAIGANYTASSYPTTVKGSSALGNDKFTTEAGSFECEVHEEFTLNGSTGERTERVEYTNCKAFGFLSATVSMGSCDWLWTAATFVASDIYSAPPHIKCTSSTKMSVTAGTCKMTVGEQTPSGSVTITNNTAAGDISAKKNVTGIAYTVTEDGFGCAFGGTGAKTGATYTQANAITMDSTNGATVDVG